MVYNKTEGINIKYHNDYDDEFYEKGELK